jgi:hypothetical protein
VGVVGARICLNADGAALQQRVANKSKTAEKPYEDFEENCGDQITCCSLSARDIASNFLKNAIRCFRGPESAAAPLRLRSGEM